MFLFISLVSVEYVIMFQDDKSFFQFGYEAVKEYSQLVERNQHRKYHYFEKFKMALYEEKAS